MGLPGGMVTAELPRLSAEDARSPAKADLRVGPGEPASGDLGGDLGGPMAADDVAGVGDA